MAQIKEEVNREARFEELQKLQEEIKQSVMAAEESFKNEADSISQSIAEDITESEPKKVTKKAISAKKTKVITTNV
jgi:sec-independent protein translocase protein TatB